MKTIMTLLFLSNFLYSHVLKAQQGEADTTIINLMIGVTPAAINSIGGESSTRAKICTTLNMINTSFRQSLIPLKINVVYSYALAIDENQYFDNMLEQLMDMGQSSPQSMRSLRDEISADIAVAIVHQDTSNMGMLPECGTSGQCQSAASAFIVVDDRCIGRNYSLARQLGYLLGCGTQNDLGGRFNPGNQAAAAFVNNLSFADAPENVYTTIMGFPDDQLIDSEDLPSLIPYWSNPNVTYHDTVIGDALHNNAAQIISAMTEVSQYRNTYVIREVADMEVGAENGLEAMAQEVLLISNINAKKRSRSTYEAKTIVLRDSEIQSGSAAEIRPTKRSRTCVLCY